MKLIEIRQKIDGEFATLIEKSITYADCLGNPKMVDFLADDEIREFSAELYIGQECRSESIILNLENYDFISIGRFPESIKFETLTNDIITFKAGLPYIKLEKLDPVPDSEMRVDTGIVFTILVFPHSGEFERVKKIIFNDIEK